MKPRLYTWTQVSSIIKTVVLIVGLNVYLSSTNTRQRVRIPPGARMSVSFECYVLSSRGLCIGLIIHPEQSYRVRSWSSIKRRPWPTRWCCAMEGKITLHRGMCQFKKYHDISFNTIHSFMTVFDL